MKEIASLFSCTGGEAVDGSVAIDRDDRRWQWVNVEYQSVGTDRCF